MQHEIINKQVSLATFDSGGTGIFAGSAKGKQVFSALVAQTATPNVPTRLLLDFANIEIATGSFLREGICAFRTHARAQWPFLYPIIANASPSILEELDMCLEPRSDAMVAVTLSSSGDITNPMIVGSLDGKQRETMFIVIDQCEVHAPTLALRSNDSATSWNNRLAALVSKGLIVEKSLGRSKRYFPLVEGLKNGN